MDLLPGLEERHYDWRGARVRYFAGGEGPPLLLSETWDAPPPLAAPKEHP